MAITQIEAGRLSNDLLLKGIIQTIVKEAPVLQYLPFMEVTGTSIRYNRESTMPAANFYIVGDTWTEATPATTVHTAALTIIGGDADVDNFLQATYTDTNDIEAEVLASRAKAVAHKFADTFLNGDTAVDAKSFDGIHKLIPAGQTLSMGTNGATITLERLDELIDLVRPGKPEMLIMSRRTRRQLKALRRNTGPIIETSVSQFGEQVITYEGIPIVIDDFVNDAQTQGSSSVASSIYALKTGVGTGVLGLQHGGITVETIGELETKDATRHRIKWYTGMALMSELGAAKLVGIIP